MLPPWRFATSSRSPVWHVERGYCDHSIEQDHRGNNQCSDPLRGVGDFEAAARFCAAQDELRAYFRSRRTVGEHITLAKQRQLFRDRWAAVIWLIAA